MTVGKRSTWFTILTNDTIRMDIAPNIILLGAPQNLINSTIIDGHLIVTLFGPITINYTITELTVTGGGAGTAANNTEEGESTARFPTGYLLIVMILIIIILLMLILKRKSIIGVKGTSSRREEVNHPRKPKCF